MSYVNHPIKSLENSAYPALLGNVRLNVDIVMNGSPAGDFPHPYRCFRTRIDHSNRDKVTVVMDCGS